jgi:hypothetical protein
MAQLLGPSRRASVLMFVLGGLLLLMGGCAAAFFSLPDLEERMARQGSALPPGITFDDMRRGAMVGGAILGTVGVLQIVLGVFVRRASRAATVSAIVLTFLVLGWFLLNLLSAFVVGGGQQAVIGACFMLVPLGLTVWQLTWLFQANGAAGRHAAWQAQAQYYQSYAPQAGYPSQQPQIWGQPQAWGPPPPGQWPPPPPQGQQNWPPPPGPG